MVAGHAEGVPSAPVTQDVTLTPATNPTLQVCIQVKTIPDSTCISTSSKTPVVVSTADVLQFNTSGSSGGVDPIQYYGVEVGQPNLPTKTCPVGHLGGYTWNQTPSGQGTTGPPIKPTGPAGVRPTAADEGRAAAAVGGGSGAISFHGTTTHLTPFPVPVFSDLEAGAFPYHDCGSYAIRTVDPNAPRRRCRAAVRMCPPTRPRSSCMRSSAAATPSSIPARRCGSFPRRRWRIRCW